MSGKPVIPGLIRRGNRFSVRIQVPKDLQEHIGKKEYWVKLGTEDRYEATSRALDKVRDKRAEFEMTRRRLRGDYRIASELADHEIQSLGREVFATHLEAVDQRDDTGEIGNVGDWDDHVRTNDEWLATLERSYAEEGASYEEAQDQADFALDKNLIKLDKASRSYKKLCRIAMDASLEVQRRVVARLHGREFPGRPDPRFVDASGQVQEFVPLRKQTTDVPASYNLTSLMNRYVSSTHRVRSEKTRKSLRGYLETTAAILGPGKDIRTVTHADCLRAREVIEKLPPNFKKLRQFDGLPVEQIAEIAQRDGMSMLSPQGVNNYVDAFYGFLRWCEGSQFIDRLPARRELLRVADPEKREEKRLPFTDEQLQIIFSTGAFETRERTSSMFWVPLIALWNGMRSNEICQLDVEDIREENGVWCFDITSVSATGEEPPSGGPSE